MIEGKPDASAPRGPGHRHHDALGNPGQCLEMAVLTRCSPRRSCSCAAGWWKWPGANRRRLAIDAVRRPARRRCRLLPESRGAAYPHTWPEDPSPEAAPVVNLDVHHVIVDTKVVPGRVTLAASTRDASRDAYGSEYDLAPTDARALSRQLMAAADECERADQADGLGVRELHELQRLQAAR